MAKEFYIKDKCPDCLKAKSKFYNVANRLAGNTGQCFGKCTVCSCVYFLGTGKRIKV